MKLEDHPNPTVRWFHRRLFAYSAFIAMLVYPALAAFFPAAILAEIAWPFYIFNGGIVGVYVGFSAWESVNINRTG